MKIFAKINEEKKCNQGTKNVIFFVVIEKLPWQKQNRKGLAKMCQPGKKINFLDKSVCRCYKSNDLLAKALCRMKRKIETIQLAPILLKRTEHVFIHAENVRNKILPEFETKNKKCI